MTRPDLGRVERVNPRDIWPHEADNFTPWLVKHLDVLREELGLNLVETETEVEVGNFRLDIKAKVYDNGGGEETAVIENQLAWSDHDHLGKLLTYAAGEEAQYVVWIAQYLTPEHRTALDWLNRLAPTKVWFFGVEVRVIKIGDSDPAPDMRVVAAPSNWYGGNWKPTPLAGE